MIFGRDIGRGLFPDMVYSLIIEYYIRDTDA